LPTSRATSSIIAPTFDVLNILKGTITDENYFGIGYTIDDGDDWTAEETWRKANPNYGISVEPEHIALQCRKAMQSPASQASFLTKHLNVWIQTDQALFDMRAWDRCADERLALPLLEGEPCSIAVDLASKTYIAAVILLFERDGTLIPFGRFYLPEAAVDESRNASYRGWAIANRYASGACHRIHRIGDSGAAALVQPPRPNDSVRCVSLFGPMWNSDSAPSSCHGAPDHQDDYGSHDRANQTGSLAGAVPTESLTQPSRDNRADNSKDGCQNEARGLVAPRRNELRNHACDKPDDDRPDNAHTALRFRLTRSGFDGGPLKSPPKWPFPSRSRQHRRSPRTRLRCQLPQPFAQPLEAKP